MHISRKIKTGLHNLAVGNPKDIPRIWADFDATLAATNPNFGALEQLNTKDPKAQRATEAARRLKATDQIPLRAAAHVAYLLGGSGVLAIIDPSTGTILDINYRNRGLLEADSADPMADLYPDYYPGRATVDKCAQGIVAARLNLFNYPEQAALNKVAAIMGRAGLPTAQFLGTAVSRDTVVVSAGLLPSTRTYNRIKSSLIQKGAHYSGERDDSVIAAGALDQIIAQAALDIFDKGYTPPLVNYSKALGQIASW